MTETLQVTELCLPGLNCPMPVLKAKKALANMVAGAQLRVISTDPHSLPDLAEFCRQTGHHLLSSETRTNTDGDKEYISLIAKREG